MIDIKKKKKVYWSSKTWQETREVGTVNFKQEEPFLGQELQVGLHQVPLAILCQYHLHETFLCHGQL